MTRREFIDQMVDRVNALPLSEIIKPYAGPYRKSGGSFWCQCPLHNGKNYNFCITDSKNIWKCFSKCNKGSIGGVSFVKEMFGLEYLDACFKIAEDQGIITHDEFVKYSARQYDDKKYAAMKERTLQKQWHQKADQKTQRASKETETAVLNALPFVCGLSEEHRWHLEHKRGLAGDKLADYFSAPQKDTPLVKGLADYFKENLGDEQRQKVMGELHLVPGFFKNKKSGTIRFTAPDKGIGFIVRDDRGTPLGVQFRRDTVGEGQTRYIWFSSKFAIESDWYEGGNSPGAPAGFIWPEDREKGALCITEGRFKAEQIAKKGNRAVYLAGVGNWKPAIDMILRNVGPKKVAYLIFDADMHGNMAVHDCMLAISQALWAKAQVRTNVIVWQKDLGKGFDDLVQAQGDSYNLYLRVLPYKKYEEIYTRRFEESLRDYGLQSKKEVKKLKTEDREDFERHLQMMVEMMISDILF